MAVIRCSFYYQTICSWEGGFLTVGLFWSSRKKLASKDLAIIDHQAQRFLHKQIDFKF